MMFVEQGEKIPLGSLSSGSIEIPVFGWQGAPLSDSERFGIDRIEPSLRWGRISCQKEVWFEVKPLKQALEVVLYGSKLTDPLFFVFYVKASQATIGEATYLPKTLRRYSGDSMPVCFSEEMEIVAEPSPHMELIPLAGGGCFWGADFLLAFSCRDRLMIRWE